MTTIKRIRFTAFGLVSIACVSSPATAVSEQHVRAAREMMDKAIDYLRAQQDDATGGWAIPPQGPHFPAITGLVITGMLMDTGVSPDDPAVRRGTEHILSHRQPDGGIYDRILASYNTAICISALSKINRPWASQAMMEAVAFLRTLQWSEESGDHPETGQVGPEHAFYGGVGYGRHSRPDNSNLNFFVQAMHDAGLATGDPAFERALVFLARTQMDDRVNDMPYAEGSRQGGFIYSTSPEGDQLGEGESKAGTVDEIAPSGQNVSRLRAYGSITYAGFKSLIYADLDADDVRVSAATDWIRRNYTLSENPGMGTEGQYYYYLTFARAMDAWGASEITLLNGDDAEGDTRDWANDLIETLSQHQNDDGSFRSVDDRWMENNPILITAYALIALGHAVD